MTKPPVTAAPNLRAMLLQALHADAALLALLRPSNPASAVDAIQLAEHLPVQTKPGLPLVPPFIVVYHEGGTTWALECHDLPSRGLHTIDHLINRLRWRFHGAKWQQPTDEPHVHPTQSYRLTPSGDLPDAIYTTRKRIARIRVTLHETL
jgi:hypothetical protein